MTTIPVEPAFPVKGNSKDYVGTGLTALEYFAAAALQGLCSNPNYVYSVDCNPKKIAGVAVQMARALIEELNRKED